MGKLYASVNVAKVLLFSTLTIFLSLSAHTQTTVVINTGTPGTAAHNAGPIYRATASSTVDASRFVYLYTQDELAAVGILPGSVISRLGWVKSNDATTTGTVSGIFRIYLKNSSATAFAAASQTWATLNTGASLVYQNLTQTIPATADPDYITFNLTNFTYTGGSLEVSTEWDINAATGNPSTGPFSWLWSTVPDKIYGIAATTLAGTATLSSTIVNGTTVSLDNRRPFIQITFLPPPCPEPPTPGTAITNKSVICLNESFTLSLSGASGGNGQTHQWQSSPDNVNWTNIAGATNLSLTTTQANTSYYRAILTCGTTSLPSASVLVTSTPPVSGTFLIDAGGTGNFTSFTAAYNFIKCGINGPVTINVKPNSGPYNEQLVMDTIAGASSTNTVTFNGNGNTITYLSTNTNERAVIKMNGTDHVTFDNLVIKAAGSLATEFGWGIQLANNADSNTIRNCVINIDTTNTNTNYAGIVISASNTSAVGTGTVQCDYNTFDNNTVTGGYYGMTLVGSSAVANGHNRIINNTFSEFYFYGVFINGSFNTLIDSNTITRPTRPNVSTFTGIYLNGLNTRVKVQRNVITNPFGGNPGSTNTFNGIHFNASDASAQLENIVSNNLIYNITGNGDVNGIFNAGSDNAWYYHNTVYLDGVSTDATDIIRGFHQTTTAAGIQFVNNIVHISRTGPSSKYVMYFNTPASDIISNYNDLFISSTEGSNNIGYNGNDQVLLVNWRTATGQDANSVSNDPVYENAPAGNFVPTNSVINNLGTAAATLVPTDLAGATRDAATPDMGAYEFAPPVCVSPPVAGDAIVSATPVCENTLVNLDVTANSTGTGQTYVWQAASDIAGPYAPISTTLTNPSFVITATASLYYRVAVTCSGNTSFSTPVFLSVNPALPGGTYTIDANQPASPTNFVSFNAAKEAMACGIAGPVVFEVEPNSGPYLEQLELDSIPGTSASNTVTFNGNGNIIKFVPTVSAQRAVIKLTGTDYVTFDSLTIDATEGAFGFGVQLVSNADSNTFTRCYIIADTSSTSTGYAGIVLGSSATSATTNGVSLCDGNVFDGNKIMGGHYGIAMVGNTANPVLNNKVLNNRIEDFYSYGVYVDISTKTLIQGNTISRPNRTVFAAFNGIYFTGASSNALIAKNRLTNPAGGDPTATDAVNGIYFTSSDAPASAPNRVVNNMIYHLNGNGTVYALYNSGSNNILYYHNTISIDHQVTTSTSATRGFYQTLSADGIEVKNNIINITRPGTGDKHGLYFGTAASTIVSNRNNVFVNGPSAVDNFFGFFGSNRVTLSDWQTASSQDANSTSIDPIFFNAAAGNFIPMQGVVDNIGEPVGVTTDIFNAPRSGTTPDAGAIEFSVIPCVTPPTPGVSVATPASNICLGQKIQLNLSGNSTGGFQKYIWQISSSATGPWTDLSDTLFSPEFEHELSSYTNTYFRAIVICSGVQDISTPVQVLLNPALVAGDYTIDPASPVSPTNFQSFATAVAALQCGIAGSVRFHVVPGTYNEQMRISRVPGASATSTVTFMSQNGDPASVTISYNSTSADSNYVVKLDSASFITYKNMTITATNATNARAVEFAGTASVDSLVNLRISAPEVATTSNTTAAVFGTALRGSDIVLKGNTILNGSSGIYLSGTTRVSDRYIVDSNIVSGSYQYGIYLANINSTSATRNKVARSGLLNTSAYGLYLSNCDSAYRVRSNEVTINNTGTAVYGIYLTGCQASAANPGIVNNNKITAAAENTGNQYGLYATSVTFTRMLNNVIVVNTAGATSYGIYNTSTGGVQYYNNTVQSSATSTTANFAAYFSQSSAANGPLNIRNNIFSHTGAGRAMNVINPRFIYSDYNMFYTNGDSIINWGTTAYKSLQNWRDTSYHDFNSIVYRPAFTSTTDLTPDLASPDVWAIHGRGEQITGNDVDFNGNPRPTTLTAGVPDLGAYEFLPTSVPVLLTAIPATPAPGITQIFMLGTDTVSKITWGANAPATITGRRYSGVSPQGLAAGQPHMYFYTDFDHTGTTPTGHRVQQFYIDPWRGLIAAEPTIKLGRTASGNNWTVASSSSVDVFSNFINENNVPVLDKFTGLTDGAVAPVPPVVVSASDSSNRGTRFWVGYGHHQDFGAGNAQEMLLYLGTGSNPATVTVRVSGTSWVKTYSVPANSVISSDFIPKYGAFDARLTEEGLSARGISIESNEPITAYAHIYGNTNSGATMLMPVGTYGYEYYAITSKQNYAANTYSWVNVVAAYDSTTVEITPSKNTLGGRQAGVPFTVQLKKGEVYQILGAIISGSNGYDLTGTKVKSITNSSGKCYPIAVFSGSSRTNLGCGTASPSSSGDNIIQQNFPYKAWGRRYLTAATSSSLGADRLHVNIFKVAVKDPTTQVKRNGSVLTDLIDNLYYQFESSGADYIEADKPVMVAQFIPSQASSSGCTQNAGNRDPEMIYLSPIEQGIKSVALYRNTEYNITTQYLTLIIPTAGVSSLQVDGSSAFDFTYPHSNLPGYTVVVKRWSPASKGQSIVTSDSAFTAITYGLGNSESYGYNAGTLVKNLNVFPSYINVLTSNGTVSSSYTCERTPFRVSFLSTVQPQSIEWNFSQVPNMTPNANVTQNNPTPVSTEVINGVTYYRYTVNQDFRITGLGTFYIPIFITHPDVDGCNNRMEFSLPVTVVAAPVPDFVNTNVVCNGSQAQFNGTATSIVNAPAASWSWDFDDNGATAATQNATHTFSGTATYDVKLTVITSDGCIGEVTKPVSITTGPVVNFVPDSLSGCPGSNITFNVQNPVAGVTYNWYTAPTGGTLVQTGNSYTFNNVTGAASLFVGSVLNGCSSAARTEVEVTVLPQLVNPVVTADSVAADLIRFAWAPVSGAIGYEVSTNGGGTWSTPSSGATGLTHTITGLPVGQSVTLVVRALGGCANYVSQPVTATTVTDEVFIPNSFTPNGDGMNDVFRVYSNVIREMRFMIFNQWGEKIFESRTQSAAWDGMHKGKTQPSGVYMYVADIILIDGTRVQRKGSVNLVR